MGVSRFHPTNLTSNSTSTIFNSRPHVETSHVEAQTSLWVEVSIYYPWLPAMGHQFYTVRNHLGRQQDTGIMEFYGSFFFAWDS